MIVFVPGYDAATNANLAVARDLVLAEDLGLLGEEATRASLLEALRMRTTEALFSMSHGRPDHLCAQSGDVIGMLLRHLNSAARRRRNEPMIEKWSSSLRSSAAR